MRVTSPSVLYVVLCGSILFQDVFALPNVRGNHTRWLSSKKSKNLIKCKEANCQEGTACNDDGNCQRCKKGTYAHVPNLASCNKCPLGKHGTDKVDSIDACVDCEPGFYADKIGLAECKPCRRGYYQNRTGQSTCLWAFDTNEDVVVCNDTIYLKEGATNITWARHYHTDEHSCEQSGKKLKIWQIVLIVFGCLIGLFICCIIKKACYC